MTGPALESPSNQGRPGEPSASRRRFRDDPRPHRRVAPRARGKRWGPRYALRQAPIGPRRERCRAPPPRTDRGLAAPLGPDDLRQESVRVIWRDLVGRKSAAYSAKSGGLTRGLVLRASRATILPHRRNTLRFSALRGPLSRQ